jgi:hypothetical protein
VRQSFGSAAVLTQMKSQTANQCRAQDIMLPSS